MDVVSCHQLWVEVINVIPVRFLTSYEYPILYPSLQTRVTSVNSQRHKWVRPGSDWNEWVSNCHSKAMIRPGSHENVSRGVSIAVLQQMAIKRGVSWGNTSIWANMTKTPTEIWPRHQLLPNNEETRKNVSPAPMIRHSSTISCGVGGGWLIACLLHQSLPPLFFQTKYLSDAIFVWCNICLFAPPVFLSTSFQMQLLSDALFDWNNICQLLSDFLFLMQYLSALSGFALCAAGKDVSELMAIVESEWIGDCQGSTEKLY